MDDTRAPIEPGPEPDTTGAAEPDDTHDPLRAEDAPAMIDEGDDHVDETRP